VLFKIGLFLLAGGLILACTRKGQNLDTPLPTLKPAPLSKPFSPTQTKAKQETNPAPPQVSLPAHQSFPLDDLDSLMLLHPLPPTAQVRQAQEPVSLVSRPLNWVIQLGAYPDINTARSKITEIKSTWGLNCELIYEAPFYKVRYGSFPTKENAEDELGILKDKGLQGWVIGLK